MALHRTGRSLAWPRVWDADKINIINSYYLFTLAITSLGVGTLDQIDSIDTTL